MKKLLSLLLCLSMLISACFFAACFDDDSDGGGEEGEDSLEISQTVSEQKMQALAESDGYLITYTYSSSGESSSTYQVGRKGDLLWTMDGDADGYDSGAAYRFDGDTVSYFSYDDYDGWEFEQSMSNSQAQTYIDLMAYTYNAWLYYGNAYDGSLTRKGTGKVAGRDCINYTFSYGNFAAKYTYDLAVDKELGITLSMHISAKTMGESGSMSYEVTEFLTGSAVRTPELPAVTSVYDICGLQLDDIKTNVGTSTGTVLQQSATLSVAVKPASTDFDTFTSWVNALADKCRAVANGGAIYESEYSDEPLTSFDFDQQAVFQIIQFVYKRPGYVIYVSASDTGVDDNSFSCGIQVYEN